MTASTKTPSLIHETGPAADVNEIYRQVGRWTWIGMGVRDIIRHPHALQGDIFLGAGIAKRRLYIKLNHSDLYDIELGHVHRRGLEYDVIEQVRDIDAENLDRTVRDLYDRHSI